MKDRRPTRADARRNYDRLVITARTAFLERGADAPLDDIAKRAGVGSATLYRHFPSRDDLLDAVLQEWVDALLTRARELIGHPSPGDALGDWLRDYLAGQPIPRGVSGIFLRVATAPWSPGGLSASCAAIHRAFDRLLVRAQEAGAITRDIDSHELLSLVDAIRLAGESADRPAEQASRMLAVVLRGLRTPNGVPAGHGTRPLPEPGPSRTPLTKPR